MGNVSFRWLKMTTGKGFVHSLPSVKTWTPRPYFKVVVLLKHTHTHTLKSPSSCIICKLTLGGRRYDLLKKLATSEAGAALRYHVVTHESTGLGCDAHWVAFASFVHSLPLTYFMVEVYNAPGRTFSHKESDCTMWKCSLNWWDNLILEMFNTEV